MPRKSKPSRPNTLTDQTKESDSRENGMAVVALSPLVGNARTAKIFSHATFGEIDLCESVKVIQDTAGKAIDGSTNEIVEMLVGQATALNAIFNELARRAALNMGEHMNATESYLRLALKAQGQCRATLEALVEIKHPRQLAFVKQANIAHGHQQVNNGPNAISEPRAEENRIQPNELLEIEHESRMDTGTTGAAIGSDPAMAALEKINRA